MSESGEGAESELLVVTNDQSFGSAVVDAVEETRAAAGTELIKPVSGALTQRNTDDFEGAIVDGQIAEPAAVVERLTEEGNLQAVVLTDSIGEDDTIAQVLNRGATDVFPRTTASPQYELAVERIATDDSSVSTQMLAEGKASYRQAYEAFFKKISEGLVVHDPDTGEIVDVNERFCEMNGYERSELLGESIGVVTAPEEAYGLEAAQKIIRQARTDGPQQFEWRNQRRNGETFPVEVDLTVIELGDTERVLATVQDITERKRREQEYGQIFNGVQDAITVHDPNSVEILDANEAYLDMFGYETVEAVREQGVPGLSVTEKGYTERRGREIHQRVVESGQSETVEWQSETQSGERIWLGVKIAPAVIGGEQRTISIHRDITERKRREQRLEVFNRILRHNLRNRLDVIRSHAEELTDRTADGHAEQIIHAVDELAAIGRRARQVDRIMSSDETPTEIDITDPLREAIEAIEPTQSNVTVQTEFPTEARLRTNKESVIMAVESALENALEHAATAVTVTVESWPDKCIITIDDDGPGIPDEELIPIEAEAETPLQHGSGLGLWQLRWCVDTLNGELSFETDGGTTVRLTVPDRRRANRPD